MRTLYVPGVWDLFHLGHLRLLKRARTLADVLVVGVVSDAGAAAYKRPPVQDQETRLAIIEALRIVDQAVPQETTDPTPILELLRPDGLVHGSDWARLREGHATLARLGIEYLSLPYTEGISTGALIERILQRGAEAVR